MKKFVAVTLVVIALCTTAYAGKPLLDHFVDPSTVICYACFVDSKTMTYVPCNMIPF